jgi:hypothetical protein
MAAPPSPRVAQAIPIGAQKTPWLAHLHPRLIGGIDCSCLKQIHFYSVQDNSLFIYVLIQYPKGQL